MILAVGVGSRQEEHGMWKERESQTDFPTPSGGESAPRQGKEQRQEVRRLPFSFQVKHESAMCL